MEILVRYHVRPEGGASRVLGQLTRRVVEETLRLVEAREDSETSVLYVDDEEMRQLNRQYRDVDQPTDVLAFAMQEAKGPNGQIGLLGDIVISLETAANQARRLRHSLRYEIAVLLVHGTLHLLGYDHEKAGDSGKNENMQALEKDCLKKMQALLII